MATGADVRPDIPGRVGSRGDRATRDKTERERKREFLNIDRPRERDRRPGANQ